MSNWPAAAESKTNKLLSGDQRAVEERKGPLKLVTWAQRRPSLAQVQISRVPDRLDANAIRFGVGEYCGFRKCAEESVSFTGVVTEPGRTAISCLQIFPSISVWEYA